MGWMQIRKFRSDENPLYWGDQPADIMDKALEDINEAYIRRWDRPVTIEELEHLLTFCMPVEYIGK